MAPPASCAPGTRRKACELYRRTYSCRHCERMNFMISHHIINSRLRAIALAAACIIASVGLAPSAMAAPFDGEWNVRVQTPDHCGNSQWEVVIVEGQVFHPALEFIG